MSSAFAENPGDNHQDSCKPPRRPLPPPRLVALVREQSIRETSFWRSSCAALVLFLQLGRYTVAHKHTSISSDLGVHLPSWRPARSWGLITKNFHSLSPLLILDMPPSVPQPGPARLKRSAGPDEWLDAAKNCKYLSEHHMKQLCEIVKEFMMEGQKLCSVSGHSFAHSQCRIEHTTCLYTSYDMRRHPWPVLRSARTLSRSWRHAK